MKLKKLKKIKAKNLNHSINDHKNATNSNNDNDKENFHHSTKNTKRNKIELKVYQLLEPYGRMWLDSRQIEIDSFDDDHDLSTDNDDNNNDDNMNFSYSKELYDSQWLDFDVTKAVINWITGKYTNLGLEIHCENCEKNGIQILHTDSSTSSSSSNSITSSFINYDDIDDNKQNNYNMNNNAENISPVLNIIGRFNLHRDKRSRQNHQHYHHHFLPNVKRKPRKTDCYEENKKCCRHSMEVVFKEIKGFEFIIQPKVFDAGYCRGKCPPRYNPAHHHALLQSLIWKQDKNKAPRPCCAPSKLVELEVLHVDENDPKKLKVSTWSDMRALECACS